MKLSQEQAGCWMKGLGLSFILFGIIGLFAPEAEIQMSLLFIFGGALWFYLFRKL